MIVYQRKECKQGKRNVLKGKTVVSTLEVPEELEKCEAQANLKKNKWGSRGRRNQVKAVEEIETTSEEDEKDPEIEVLDVIAVVPFRCWWNENFRFLLVRIAPSDPTEFWRSSNHPPQTPQASQPL